MKKKIQACSGKCIFDWVDFHKKLDIAIAHIINEQDSPLSHISLLQMIIYSHAKSELQRAYEKN